MTEVTDRRRAVELDTADELAGFRARFVEPDPNLIYLDGNSLGRLPAASAARLRETVDEQWGAGLVRSWSRWIDLPTRVGDLLGEHVLGAAPGQVAIADSTTVNLYKLAAAAVDARPGRRVVVIEQDAFPTDRYLLDGLAAQHGLQVRAVDCDPVHGPGEAELARAIDAEAALVCLSHVGWGSGVLLDLPSITELAHDAGAMVLWDLSHAAGAVVVDLDTAGVDLAAGCTYKYLNAGPGSPAFLYVRRDLQDRLRQPIWGWFGQRDQFALAERYDPESDVRRFLSGTPSVLGTVAVEEGVRLIAEAGIGALRAKGMAMTSYLVELTDAWLAPLGFSVASPRDPARRGSHVTLRHPRAWQISQAGIGVGVVGDFRAPDRLRLGPAPLSTRFTEVWEALDRIRRLVEGGEHLRQSCAPGRVT